VAKSLCVSRLSRLLQDDREEMNLFDLDSIRADGLHVSNGRWRDGGNGVRSGASAEDMRD
jgi:hypothetical protein